MREISQIDADLIALIPESQRRNATHRICEELGMNALLDERLLAIELELLQAHEDYKSWLGV